MSDIIIHDVFLDLIIRTLGYIDTRLVGHGERVAYICMKLLDTADFHEKEARDRLLLLSLLHDVGAYKTEDIDKMVEFETTDVSRHAVYGYLFLKNRAAFGDDAMAILYHHTPFSAFPEDKPAYMREAALIHLCDRVDILGVAGVKNYFSAMRAKSGSLFDPALVELLGKCEERYSLFGKLTSGEWESEFYEMKRSVSVSDTEAAELIRMLVYAIDFRSEQTVSHTAGVVSYARELGIRMGLDGESLDELSFAAFVHDIGKIATPVSILEKPGRLTDG